MALLVSTLLARGAILIFTILASHSLSEEAMSNLTLGIIATQTCIIFSLLGVTNFAIRHAASLEGESRVFILNNIIFLVIVSSLIMAGVQSVLLYYGFQISMRESFLFSIALFSQSLSSIISAILQGVLKYSYILLSSLFFFVVLVLLGVFSAYGHGVDFITVYAISSASQLLCMIILSRWFGYVRLSQVAFKTCLEIFYRALPAFASGIIVMPALLIGVKLLVLYSHPFEVSLYNAALQWRNIIAVVPVVLQQSLLPVLFRMKASEALIKSKSSVFPIATLSVFVFIVFFVFKPVIFSIYPDSYLERSDVFLVIISGSLVAAINSFCGNLLFVVEKYWVMFTVNFLWVTYYFSFVFLIWHFYHVSALGMAFAFLGSQLMHLVTQLLFLNGRGCAA